MMDHGSNVHLKDEIRDYWSERAPTFDESTSHKIEDQYGLPEWQRFLRTAFELNDLKGQQVLDIACGTGEVSRALTSIGASVTGLDFSETMLGFARTKLAERDWRFVQADAETMFPLADASFDLAITRHLAWTLTDPLASYKTWLRVLRPGGKLLVVDGNFKGTKSSLLRWRHWLADRIDTQKRAPGTTNKTTHDAISSRLPYRKGLEIEELSADLQSAGFVNVRPVDLTRLYGAGMRGHPLPERLRQSAERRYALVCQKP
ncbi:Ubiquinone/menaquinone biosynthesis C-methylase UbiE [Monaibacterium marinum]|uniref:Ubiquinone/menaquinone biosynthesis C-methylase UbiE n=1 Tax=Pontivivens marinum TaxID=1690039 RepID=A0A2C9CRG0_9RHOB|nr:class I SAM-dependent methyltransferase [Monaibacterium marinum]SOH93783.1 Ubiquinone/menaquinone biosynthesis C-methylase UbiE [Monaibacterium marinum]